MSGSSVFGRQIPLEMWEGKDVAIDCCGWERGQSLDAYCEQGEHGDVCIVMEDFCGGEKGREDEGVQCEEECDMHCAVVFCDEVSRDRADKVTRECGLGCPFRLGALPYSYSCWKPGGAPSVASNNNDTMVS
eukprot:9590901-Ditylum_brightwellii.AAC.1